VSADRIGVHRVTGTSACHPLLVGRDGRAGIAPRSYLGRAARVATIEARRSSYSLRPASFLDDGPRPDEKAVVPLERLPSTRGRRSSTKYSEQLHADVLAESRTGIRAEAPAVIGVAVETPGRRNDVLPQGRRG